MNTHEFKVGVAQIAPIVGDFEGNQVKILEAYERAHEQGARLLLTPELSVCGYPLYDLLDRPELFSRTKAVLEILQAATVGKKTALVVGHVVQNTTGQGKPVFNQLSIFENGKQVFFQHKILLPTYDVFDESRYFESGKDVKFWNCDGHKLGFAICEDLWAKDPSQSNLLYGRTDPVEELHRLNVKAVFAIAASPFYLNKGHIREAVHVRVAKDLGLPVFYCNQVGATDDVVYDGASFVAHSSGILWRASAFKEALTFLNWNTQRGTIECPEPLASIPLEMALLHGALVRGLKDYFSRTGFKKAVLGLSGGIDSALVAVLATQALGAENVLAIAMPSQYSSPHSLTDAEELARRLGIRYDVRPIKFLFSTANRELAQGLGDGNSELKDLAQQNLQARLRGIFVMTLSNHYNALTLTTSNKSELATGYGTLYGDMAGAMTPIGDLYKTQVYALARYINETFGATLGGGIPENSIAKPPSAELKPGQVDQDSLPPYEVLDPMLADYLEEHFSVDDLEAKHGQNFSEKGWIKRVLRLVEINEFKRRQAPFVLKVSKKAFGMGRRVPVAKRLS